MEGITKPPVQPAAPSSDTPAQPSEVVSHIPVREQNQSPKQMQPQVSPLTQSGPAEDHDLDKILKDINKDVSKSTAPPPKKSKFSWRPAKTLKKTTQPAAQPPKAHSKMLLTDIAAVLVAGSLILLAVRAYHGQSTSASTANGPPRVGTTQNAADTITTAGGKLVTPSSLQNFATLLDNKMNSMNDSQDFSPNDLSDSSLGL